MLSFAAMIVCAGVASASIVTVSPCSVLEGPNTGPSGSSTCSVTADPGFFINSVTVTLTSDYTGFQSGNPVVTETYSFVTNGAGFGAIPNGVVTTSCSGSPVTCSSNPVQNFNSTANGNFGTSVTETFNMSNTVAGGAVTGASGVMTISATESPNGVPEPMTLSMMGAGLLGLGLLRRRYGK
jgi:hypothetical protein